MFPTSLSIHNHLRAPVSPHKTSPIFFLDYSLPLVSIYDGLVGGVLLSGGYFVTTPNANELPTPPFGGNCKVYLCSSFRYGDDDPTQWPQPLSEKYQYLAAVPIVSPASVDPPAIMARPPDRADFIEDRGAVISGIGRINDTDYADLDTPCRQIITRACSDGIKPLITQVAKHVAKYIDLLRRFLFRLKNLSTSLPDMQFCVRAPIVFFLMKCYHIEQLSLSGTRVKIQVTPSTKKKTKSEKQNNTAHERLVEQVLN